MRELLGTALATAVAAVTVVVPTAASAPATASELAGRTADLTTANRVPGAPAPGTTPAEQLNDVRVDIDLLDESVYVEGHLAAPPTGTYGNRPYLQVEPGTWDGSTCRAIPGAGAVGDDFTASGEAVEFSYGLPAGFAQATCVVAFSFADVASRSAYDVFSGPLADRIIAPDLAIGDVALLGSKKIDLVRGVWIPVDVDVSNAGEGTAYRIDVTGKGKGLKVKPGLITDLSRNGDDPMTSTATVMVKLTGTQKKSSLRLTATSAGVKATRTVKVRSVKAPPRARPGRWGSSSVSFTVTAGKVQKVKGFRIRTETECSSSAYDTMNTYTVPTAPISGAGIVDAGESRSGDAGFTVGLQMRVAGTKATRGTFFYSGPAGCFARDAVTATWVGR